MSATATELKGILRNIRVHCPVVKKQVQERVQYSLPIVELLNFKIKAKEKVNRDNSIMMQVIEAPQLKQGCWD